MALSHLKVLDLTSNLSGPYCAMILADQGADVIKIERPNVGDDMRLTPPFINGESAPFMSANRNKRSVILDLKTNEGLADFKKLVADADILIENFRAFQLFGATRSPELLHQLLSTLRRN